ncbi:hypothetical protein C0989_010822, partial [Termitomyces sp. Mn162]
MLPLLPLLYSIPPTEPATPTAPGPPMYALWPSGQQLPASTMVHFAPQTLDKPPTLALLTTPLALQHANAATAPPLGTPTQILPTLKAQVQGKLQNAPS